MSVTQENLVQLHEGPLLGDESFVGPGKPMTPPDAGAPQEAEWVRVHTQVGLRKALGNNRIVTYEGQTLFRGSDGALWPTISSDTTDFEGRVDLRTYAAGTARGSAILIESEGVDSDGYAKLREKFVSALGSDGFSGDYARDRKDTLEAVYHAVRGTMWYDLDGVVRLEQEQSGHDDSRQINLNAYLKAGIGVCAEMGLAAGWLAASLKHGGYTVGLQTVEVNQREIGTERDAHEWMRDTPEDGSGDVIIIDPAHEIHHTLDEIFEMSLESDTVWNYFHEGEREVYQQRYEARQASKNAHIPRAAHKKFFSGFARKAVAATVENPTNTLLDRKFYGDTEDVEAIVAAVPRGGEDFQYNPGKDKTSALSGTTRSLTESPVASVLAADGNTEQLSNITIVGNTVLGTVAIFDATGSLSEVSVRALPYGINQRNRDPQLLGSVRFVRGATDNQMHMINIGREEQVGAVKNQIVLHNDGEVSREQLTMIVLGGKNPVVSYVDKASTNGTVVLNAKSLQNFEHGLFRSLAEKLATNPGEWSIVV